MDKFNCASCNEELGEELLGPVDVTGQYKYKCPFCKYDSYVKRCSCKTCNKYHSNITPIFSYCDEHIKQKQLT